MPQGGSTNGAVAIEYREFGVRLNVAAQVLSDQRIVLKLTPEVSELDYARSEEHTSELQSLMRISYAVFCLKKKNYSHSFPYSTTQSLQERRYHTSLQTIIYLLT